MLNTLQQTFALTQQGAKNLRSAIFTQTLLNFSFLLPTTVAFIFLDQAIKFVMQHEAMQVSSSIYIPLGIAILVIMYAIAHINYEKCFTKIYDESSNRRIKLAETLRKLPLSFFAQKNVSDLSETIMNDTTQIEELFSHSVPQLFAAAISLTVTICLLFFYQWQMTLALFWTVPVALLTFNLSNKRTKRIHQTIYDLKRGLSEHVQETIENAQEIKAYHQVDQSLNELNEKVDAYENHLIKDELLLGAFTILSSIILKLGLPSVAVFGAYLLLNDQISLFTYFVFLIIVSRVYDPFIDVMNNLSALLFLNTRIQRMKDMDNLPLQTGATDFKPTSFDITFDNVDFSYNKGENTLKSLSFCAQQNQVTALIGPSGSGKSTVAKLIARFWDVDQGTIYIGEHNIAEIDPEALMQHISIVFQDVLLFDQTALENIRLGRKDASDEDVMQAAKLAQCDDFINKLPQGYDTLIGENGERLSGGERQRISIARALLKDAPIILLDEATASLDANNESKIQGAISELIKNKTVIVIAHRMRTIANADKIIAIDDGHVQQMGSPAALKQEEGLFKHMLSIQYDE